MPVTVAFDPNNTQRQVSIIPDATVFNDGVMTKAMASKLSNIGAGAQIVWKASVPWSTMAPIIAAAGICKVVFDTEGQTGQVNFTLTGEADLSHVVFDSTIGNTADTSVTLVADPAFRLLVPNLYLRSLFLITSAPLYNGTLECNVSLDGVTIDCQVAPMITATPGASINCHESTLINEDAAAAMFVIGSTDFSLLALYGNSGTAAVGHIIDGNAPGVPLQFNFDDTASVDTRTLGPNLATTSDMTSLAWQNQYIPTAGLFVAPDPPDVQTALNRMATLLKTLNGGNPIP